MPDNNVVEADHGKLMQLIRPVRGFKTLETAYVTIRGIEMMRGRGAPRRTRRQRRTWQARLQAVQFISQQFERQDA